jgi:hypothetical protein
MATLFSYRGGRWFKSRTGHKLFLMTIFVIFLSPLRQITGRYPNLCRDQNKIRASWLFNDHVSRRIRWDTGGMAKHVINDDNEQYRKLCVITEGVKPRCALTSRYKPRKVTNLTNISWIILSAPLFKMSEKFATVGSTTRLHDKWLQRNGSWWNYEPAHKFRVICNSIPIRHNKECYMQSPFPRKLCADKRIIKTHPRPTVRPELRWDRQAWITCILQSIRNATQRQDLSKSLPEHWILWHRTAWYVGTRMSQGKH